MSAHEGSPRAETHAELDRLANMAAWCVEHGATNENRTLAEAVIAYREARTQPSTPAAQGDALELKRLSGVIERDRSLVARTLGQLRKVLNGYDWLREGRGPYTHDDDRWHHEFSRASAALHNAMEPLATLASDWSDCPKTEVEVREARAALRSPAAPSDPEETQIWWLIERGQSLGQRPTLWWTAAGDQYGPAHYPWTEVAQEAAQFPTREAAEQEIKAHSHPLAPSERHPPFGIAVQHGFVGLRHGPRDPALLTPSEREALNRPAAQAGEERAIVLALARCAMAWPNASTRRQVERLREVWAGDESRVASLDRLLGPPSDSDVRVIQSAAQALLDALDLESIRKRVARADDGFGLLEYAPQAIREDIPTLIAEVERLRAVPSGAMTSEPVALAFVREGTGWFIVGGPSSLTDLPPGEYEVRRVPASTVPETPGGER